MSRKPTILFFSSFLVSTDFATSVFKVTIRGIEWSLRAFASMRAVCLFLRARAVIKFFLRAASSFENTDGEQLALRVLRKFSASRNLSFIDRIRCFSPSNS